VAKSMTLLKEKESRLLLEVGTTYSSRNPITTFESVAAFTFFPMRIARIVLRSSPVSLVVFRNPRPLISVIKLSLTATRPPERIHPGKKISCRAQGRMLLFRATPV